MLQEQVGNRKTNQGGSNTFRRKISSRNAGRGDDRVGVHDAAAAAAVAWGCAECVDEGGAARAIQIPGERGAAVDQRVQPDVPRAHHLYWQGVSLW